MTPQEAMQWIESLGPVSIDFSPVFADRTDADVPAARVGVRVRVRVRGRDSQVGFHAADGSGPSVVAALTDARADADAWGYDAGTDPDGVLAPQRRETPRADAQAYQPRQRRRGG